jgi:hypothetical protein
VHKIECKLATKPEAISLGASISTLSVTQLKNVVRAKAKVYAEDKKKSTLAELEKIIEKEKLVRFVERHVQPQEVEALLAGYATTTASASSSSASQRNKQREAVDAALKQQSGQKNSSSQPIPTAEQVIRQCQEMRKNPEMVRRANPDFAKLSDKEIFDLANEQEKMARDPVMFRQVMEQQEKMRKDPKLAKEYETMQSTAKRDPGFGKAMQELQEGVGDPKKMTDEWLKKTISTLKKYPDAIKSMAKMNVSEQKEKAVGADQVTTLVDALLSMEEAELFNCAKLIKDGLTDPSKRTDEWIQQTISMVKKNSSLIKTLVKTNSTGQWTPEQVEATVDFICGLGDWILYTAAKSINWGIEKWPSISAGYKKVDDAIFGCGQYIIMMIVMVILWFSFKFVWWVVMLIFSLLQTIYHLVVGSSKSSAGAAVGGSVKLPVDVGMGGGKGKPAPGGGDEFDF